MEVLIWLALCALVAWFADSRGRNPYLCFLWAVVISPLLAFIIYAIMGRKYICQECQNAMQTCSKCKSNVVPE